MSQKVTPEDIRKRIVAEYSTTLDKAFSNRPIHDSMRVVTLHVIVLDNGFVVTGTSACADPAEFNAKTGIDIARRAAVDKVWAHLGFELKTKMAETAPVGDIYHTVDATRKRLGLG